MKAILLVTLISLSACFKYQNEAPDVLVPRDDVPAPRDDAPREQVETGHFKWSTFAGIDLDKPETLGQKDFGAIGKLVDLPSTIKKLGFGLNKYKMRSVKGDGSCFMRAIVQSLLYPVLHVEKDFKDFIAKIKLLPSETQSILEENRNRLEMLDQQPVDFAVKLFYKLKASNEDQRYEFYNYQKIDLFLDWFFRSVIALQEFRNEQTATDWIKEHSHKNALETLTHRAWGGDYNHNEAITTYFQTKLVSVRNFPFGDYKRQLRHYGQQQFSLDNSFAFLPASKYTQMMSLVSRSHQELIERTTLFRADRDNINVVKCEGLKYLIEDGEIDENSRYNDDLGDNAGFLHLWAAYCDFVEFKDDATKKILASTFLIRDTKGNTPWHYYAALNDKRNWGTYAMLKGINSTVTPSATNSAGELPIEKMFNKKDAWMNIAVASRLIKDTKMSVEKKKLIKKGINSWDPKDAVELTTGKESLLKAVDAAGTL